MLCGEADPAARERAGARVSRERARARPDQLAPHPRELLPPVQDGHLARAERVHRYGHALPGRALEHRVHVPAHREVHVPRPPERVRRAGVDGVLRRRGGPGVKPKALASPLVPVVALAVLLVLLLRGGASFLGSAPAPIERLYFERTVLRPDEITVVVRNTGPEPVSVGQVLVN